MHHRLAVISFIKTDHEFITTRIQRHSTSKCRSGTAAIFTIIEHRVRLTLVGPSNTNFVTAIKIRINSTRYPSCIISIIPLIFKLGIVQIIIAPFAVFVLVHNQRVRLVNRSHHFCRLIFAINIVRIIGMVAHNFRINSICAWINCGRHTATPRTIIYFIFNVIYMVAKRRSKGRQQSSTSSCKSHIISVPFPV